MSLPCQIVFSIYNSLSKLQANHTLKSPHLSLNLSLKLETHHILTLNLTHLTYKHEHSR